MKHMWVRQTHAAQTKRHGAAARNALENHSKLQAKLDNLQRKKTALFDAVPIDVENARWQLCTLVIGFST